jgi:hypothetical protein
MGDASASQDPVPARVAEILRSAKMDDDRIGRLVDLVAGFRQRRLPVRVLTKGIPWPDLVEVQTVVGKDEVGAVTDLLGSPQLDELEVFPLGIVDPEIFFARFTFR